MHVSTDDGFLLTGDNMKIAVIGAGPAGLMAAAQAARGGSVTLFERNEKPGKKLYITGKGRCNVTNMCSPGEFLEKVVSNPRFLYGSIFSYPPEKTVELIERMGIRTKVERGNRVFPLSDKASDITRALVKNAESNGVVFAYENVLSIKRNAEGFCVVASRGEYSFDKVILACGGVSYPGTGSNGDGFKLAESLGHTIVPLAPALVPLVVKQDVSSLKGLTLKNVSVTVSCNKFVRSLFGEMSFVGKNSVAGPVVLSLSSFINRRDLHGAKLYVDLKPALVAEKLDKRILGDFAKFKNKKFNNCLDELLPKVMIPYMIETVNIPREKPVNEITRHERERLLSAFKALEFDIVALADISLAIVTAGGINVSEVNPKTMESKLCRGLYFAGEMLDVDALTGGYNIQIALSTGYAAGKNAGEIYD